MTKKDLKKDLRSVLHNWPLTNDKINFLCQSTNTAAKQKSRRRKKPSVQVTYFKISLILTIIYILIKVFDFFSSTGVSITQLRDYARSQPCITPLHEYMFEITRPKLNCDFCAGLKSADQASSIDKENFLQKYAYTNVPLHIKGMAKEWPASSIYSYEYFKKLYTSIPNSFKYVQDQCQFFAYETEFKMFEEVFQMSDQRSRNEPGEKTWYIGWCDSMTAAERELKKHYRRPKFLPAVKVSSDVQEIDWIFMGWPGQGAPIHIDKVQAPSWQAQLQGTKTWLLYPSVECESVCHPLNITLEQGDIIIVDTNKWFHATYIHPGNMSISVGSEY